MKKELSAIETLEITERIQHAWLTGLSKVTADHCDKTGAGNVCATEFSQGIEYDHVAQVPARVSRARTGALAKPVFQGGTCLHLVHGSPRFSMDMDFLVESVEG